MQLTNVINGSNQGYSFEPINDPRNLKEISVYAKEQLKLIKSHSSKDQVTELKSLKNFVHFHITDCNTRFNTRWSKIIAFFGFGKRVGIVEAQKRESKIEIAINRAIDNLDAEERVKKLPNFFKKITNRSEAEKLFSTFKPNSTIVWIDKDSNQIIKTRANRDLTQNPNKYPTFHFAFKNATQYELTQKSFRCYLHPTLNGREALWMSGNPDVKSQKL